jgi:hypothetical protein
MKLDIAVYLQLKFYTAIMENVIAGSYANACRVPIETLSMFQQVSPRKQPF